MIGIAKSVRAGVQPCTSELWHKAIGSERVKMMCAEIEDALESVRRGDLKPDEFETIKAKLKRQLPIITPHATFRGGRRIIKMAKPSGLSMYDIDHISGPRQYFEEKIQGREAELGIVLAHITPSTEGLRLVFRMPAGMDLAEAQRWMQGQLGDEAFDECCKDLARCSFLVPEDYILFVDEEQLFAEHVVPLKAQQPEVKKAEKSVEAVAASADNQLSYRGVAYAEIIKQWFKQTGGEPVEGDRNSRLFQLACELRFIAGSEETLLAILPSYGLDAEEMCSIVRSAMKEEYRSRRMSRNLQAAIAAAEGGTAEVEEADDAPEMPKKLPSLIALLVSKTPQIYQPAVAHAVFPSLAAHLWRTRFRYIDGVEHEATLMNILMAGTGAGKSCIVKPIKYIMADIRKRDAENRERERAWKDEVNRKGSNKDKRERPAGLVIQQVNPDMTNPAFVMRMKEAEEHFLYAQMNEIDQFDALRGSAKYNGQFQIMCLAFDPDNDYGQDRVGTQSVTENVQIRFNWNASTTVQKGQRYFSKVLTDGPISRINFCTIPEREIGADMPVYGEYGAQFEEDLRPYIENLTKATGLVDCPQAVKLIKRLKEETADFARQSQSRIYENLSFRALVIAYLKACVLYVANGMKWEKTMEDFIRWSLNYDLWTKMHFFGAAIEAAENDTRERIGSRGPRNLLTMLPNEFTMQQAANVRQGQGLSEKGTYNMLHNWKKRGYVRQISASDWAKA